MQFDAIRTPIWSPRGNAIRFMADVTLVAGCGAALHIAFAETSGTRRTDLQRHDLEVAGREVIQTRVDFAPGSAAGRHSHPGAEIIYVLEGSIEYQVDGRAPLTLAVGDVLFVPAGTIHSAGNVGAGAASELATYVVAKDRPLVKVAE